MKIVITGATGFIGQNFIPMLVQASPDVEILTVNRSVEKAQKLFPQPQCKHISTEEMSQIVDFNPELVYHLATLSTSRNDRDIIEPMMAANITFGVQLLHYISQCKQLKLFVNIGTFAQYRLGTQQINDAYLYSATKTAFRQFVEYYSNAFGFKYVQLVPYTIYGGKDTAKKLIDYIIESTTAETPVDMTLGEQILDFTHVEDVAGLFIHIMQNLNLFENIRNGEEFHLGTGKGTTPRELAAIVEKEFGRKCNINWGGRPYRPMDTMHSVAPIAKNLELLHWRAKISIEEGVKMMRGI
ncbi:MAG: NAD(P)-dependent oxidoreductase [Bacteroidales bacterium]|nr:NAD(P)-dependent oxidoreductase [Bacteroidales bacterium]